MNKVILVGRVGQDPEVKTVGESTFAKFSIATDESYKDKSGQKVPKTEWHNVVAWGNLADLLERYVKKGSQLCVEGKIQTRSWEDKDNVKKYITEIAMSKMEFLGDSGKKNESTSVTSNEFSENKKSENATSNQANSNQNNNAKSTQAVSAEGFGGDDDLPF